MTDIVERLRDDKAWWDDMRAMRKEAADEIERLRLQVASQPGKEDQSYHKQKTDGAGDGSA